MSAERLLGVTARLLAADYALTSIGVMIVVWRMWRHAGQPYGPDGTVLTDQALGQRLVLLVFDLWMRAQGKSRFRRIDVHVVLLSVGRHDQEIRNDTICASTVVLGQCGVVWCGSAGSAVEDD